MISIINASFFEDYKSSTRLSFPIKLKGTLITAGSSPYGPIQKPAEPYYRTIQLKALTIEVGTRRPLIVSAGGLAILAALPKDEARAVIDDNLKRVGRFGEARIRSLKRVIRQSQSCGYGVSESDIVPGISAFGVPIRNLQGDPFASISVVGASESFPSSWIPEVMDTLEKEARVIAREAERLLDRGE